jgi:transposase
VQRVERWVLARLRHQTFFSLSELNQAMQPLLQRLNERDFKKLPGCRRDWFEQLDQPALRALPAQRYEFAAWKTARVNIDYHVEFKRHYYSVPYTLVRQTVDLRVTAQTLEVFHRGQRVACHRRNELPGRHTTINTHRPKAHRDYADWTPERLVNWAAESGPHTAQLIRHILSTRAHPQQGYRSCLGIMRLGKKYGTERLEAACQRALLLQACSYKSLESILKRQLDRQPLPDAATESAVTPEHDNIRGPHYYH